ncbi:MAG: circadian clock protein KaiC [Blastocatellia bacterium]|jgi:circadian clock protein KaiC|nr:circadian clock protein KaiC [Blastocatellia bacterium]
MIDRVATGIAGLDEILNGGIPTNTISVIMGAPGTGKTILAEQIAFTNATAEAPALYLTTMSEPLEKFIMHGQNYGFFDESQVGVSVHFEDLGLMLRERGIAELSEVVAEMLTAFRPRYVFIDSFKALNELLIMPQDRRTVIFDLASVLSAYQCTSFLIGEYADGMMTELPEFAIADVVLQMIKLETNVREERFIRVEKLRSSNSIPGLHAFAITPDGLEVYPRLLTPKVAPDYSARPERVNTGIKGLDEMISDGFWRGSTTLVAGPPGAGKTIIGLQFIGEGALKGEPGIYLGFQENPTQLARVMRNLGLPVEKLVNDGFELMYQSPVEVQLDKVVNELFRRVRAGKVKRVVIDALGDVQRASVDRQRFANMIYALMQWFAAENVTCLLTYEMSHLFEVHGISDEQISNMSDNVVLLRFQPGPELKRTLRIIKTRGSDHDHYEHEIRITSQGLIVEDIQK